MPSRSFTDPMPASKEDTSFDARFPDLHSPACACGPLSSVCVCVCVYVCVCVFVQDAYLHTRICACACAHAHARTRTRTHTHTQREIKSTHTDTATQRHRHTPGKGARTEGKVAGVGQAHCLRIPRLAAALDFRYAQYRALCVRVRACACVRWRAWCCVFIYIYI